MDTIKFTERLQQVLGKKKWTQKRLAHESGITERTISRWMKDKVKPDFDSIKKIAQATGYSADWLIGEESQEELINFFKLDEEIVDVKIENGKAYPFVKTYDDEKNQLHFYCIHCRTWHHHGRGEKNEPYQEGAGGYAGHRVAHCIANNSPFRKNGIILYVVGKFDEVKKRHKNEKSLLCPKCYRCYSAAFNACDCGFTNKERKSKYPELAKLYQIHFRKTLSVDNKMDAQSGGEEETHEPNNKYETSCQQPENIVAICKHIISCGKVQDPELSKEFIRELSYIAEKHPVDLSIAMAETITRARELRRNAEEKKVIPKVDGKKNTA